VKTATLICGLLLIAGRLMAASITIDSVSPFGADPNAISGRVTGVDFSQYVVAPYIQVEGAGWWTKPYDTAPTVNINPDGTWLFVRPRRNFLHFSSSGFAEEFCFGFIFPSHPPDIRPISLVFSESRIYFLSSMDLISQRSIKNIFNKSIFLMTNWTYGIFSSGFKKVAIAIFSSISISRSSTFCPKVKRCAFGKIL